MSGTWQWRNLWKPSETLENKTNLVKVSKINIDKFITWWIQISLECKHCSFICNILQHTQRISIGTKIWLLNIKPQHILQNKQLTFDTHTFIHTFIEYSSAYIEYWRTYIGWIMYNGTHNTSTNKTVIQQAIDATNEFEICWERTQ